MYDFVVLMGHLSFFTVNAEVFLMAIGGTTLSDSTESTVQVSVGFSLSDVESIASPVTINFIITSGERSKENLQSTPLVKDIVKDNPLFRAVGALGIQKKSNG